MSNQTIHIRKQSDILPNSGKQVAVFGKYTPVDVRKNQTGEAYYAGHAAVELEDGTLIFIEPPHLEGAIRSPEEIDTYHNQDVVVEGFLFSETPRPTDGGAYMKVPCLMFSVVSAEHLYKMDVTEIQTSIRGLHENIEIKKYEDIEPNHRSLAHVFGTYVEVDIRPDKTGTPVYKGHVAVKLDDGTLVYLFPPYDDEAIRPTKEIKTYKDKVVVAYGQLMKKSTPPKSDIPYTRVPSLETRIIIMTTEKYNSVKAIRESMETK